MSEKGGRKENLVTLTSEKAREYGALGGKRSGEVKREKKLMSRILADYLQKEHEVLLRDDSGNVIDREKVSAEELINHTVTAILDRGDSSSATIIKTIGELTEGKTVKLLGDEENPLSFKFVDPPNASPKDI